MKRRVRDVLSTVIAVGASLVSSMYVSGAEDYVPGAETIAFTWWSGLSLLAAAGAAVMLCWRHTLPVIVTAVAVAPPLLLGADSLAALIALAALAASRRDWVLWVGGVLVFTATALAVGRDIGRHPDVTIAGELAGPGGTTGKLVWALVLAAALTGAALLAGATKGVRGDLRRKEADEQRLRAEMTRRAERTRIAREMHDVLGHRLSLLSLQAGALEVGGHADPEKAAEAARTVRGTARQSLEDLRQVIGVLRDGKGFAEHEGDPEPAGRALPGLADIPELVANSRRSGLTINVTVLIDEASGAPEPLGTAAYRILQESLTNVLRHAPRATTELTVRGGPGVGLALEVVNPLPEAARPSPGSGTGLTGIAERVALLGGNVSAGPTGEGVFALRAWLPWAHH